MSDLITALAPAFAIGFAIQRIEELVELLLNVSDPTDEIEKKKKSLFSFAITLLLGLIITFAIGLRVLKHLGLVGWDIFDGIITAFIISAGTEGFNSIVKFVEYKKDEQKVRASFNPKLNN